MPTIDINMIKRKVLIKYPSFGIILANTPLKEDNECETAATDAENIYYNSTFMSSLEVEEQVFVIAHEVSHIALDHIYRSEDKEPDNWNIATDAVINANLEKDGLPIPKGAIKIKNAIKYNAEKLYEELEREPPKMKPPKNHKIWEKAIQKKNKQKQQGNTSNKEIEKTLKNFDETDFFAQNRQLKKELLEQERKAKIKKSMNPGSGSNSIKRKIDNIGTSKPLIDWRLWLKEAIKTDADWSYQNAEIEDGVITARLEEFHMPDTEIILDTSGSIDENLLRNFLKECKHILRNSKVKVGCFDTKFYGFQDIRCMEDIENITFMGGGGTNFDVAINAFSNRTENKIIFTDGDAKMPEKILDVIWIVFGKIKINPKGGKVIYIDESQLINLMLSSQIERNNKHTR